MKRVSKKENDDPKLMIMDSALFITSLFALVSALTAFFSTDRGYWLWGDYPLVGWTCRGLAFYSMLLLSTIIMDQTQIVANVLHSNPSSNFGLYGPLVGCLLCNKLPTSQPQSVPCSIAFIYPGSPSRPSLLSQKRFNIEVKARAHHVIKKSEKLWHIVNP